jgi:RNA polymerase sigma-70 factor (ECF subfamily)
MDEEKRLIEDARNGSQPAFVGLLRLHQGRVRGYLLRYVRSEDLVEDLAQEAFLRAFRDLHQYKGQSPFRIWLLGIARHRALDYLRKEEVRRSGQGRALDSALARWRAQEASFDEDTLDDRDRELSALRDCITRLAPASANLVADHYFKARHLADVARQLGKTEGATKMMLFRIREALHKCLERWMSPKGATP